MTTPTITPEALADLKLRLREACDKQRAGAHSYLFAEALKALPDPQALRRPSYEALDIIARSVAGALARAGVNDCDDPGEAIDVLREGYERRIAELQAAPAAAGVPSSLDFDTFRRANVARCEKWHPDGIASWSPSDWLTAAMGELGELASEVKMHNRVRDGLAGNKEQVSADERTRRMANEAADVVTYLDLFCAERGIDLGAAVVRKFNEVSERVGFPDRIFIGARPAAQPQAVIDLGTIEFADGMDDDSQPQAEQQGAGDAEVLDIVARYVGKTSSAYRYIAADLATRQPVGEPAIWVSPEQLRAHKDRHTGGDYLPARKTPEGNFTMPLYTAPPAQVEAPFELRICEIKHTVLKPNKTYVFTVDPNCAACRARAAYAVGETDAPPASAAVPVDAEILDALRRMDGIAMGIGASEEIAQLYNEAAVELAGKMRHLLSSAPQPAALQGVDLGQFREAVQYASRTCPHVDLAAKLHELLALIDSKAGRNG